MKRRSFVKGSLAVAGLMSIPMYLFPTITTRSEVEQLQDALNAGAYSGGPSTLTHGGVLQVEDLDATLKLVKFDEKHIKLWKAI